MQKLTPSERNMESMSFATETCVQNCIDSYKICSLMIQHCLMKGGKHADPQHIILLEDCSKICNLSADFMMRQSDYHTSTCAICSEVCLACAESCDALAVGDEMMQTCVNACRKCSESCLEMAKMQ